MTSCVTSITCAQCCESVNYKARRESREKYLGQCPSPKRGAERGEEWEGCPLPSRLGDPQRSGQKRILAYFEGHRRSFLHLYADDLSSSNSFVSHWGHVTFGGIV